MKLVEQHIVTSKLPYYDTLVDMSIKSTNLYNYALFCIRQHFFRIKGQRYEEDIFDDTDKLCLNYYDLNRKLKETNQTDYRQLPSNVAQEVLKSVDQDFKSFYALIKKKKEHTYDKKINIPHYKKKESRSVVILNVSNISHTDSKFKIPKTDVYIDGMLHLDKATQIRIVPRNGYFVIEEIYERESKPLKYDNKRYLSIDIGIDNLATCTSNVDKAFIINGRPVKSINHYFNKTKAKYQSKNKKTDKLSLKRSNKIKWYFHNASRYIIDYCVRNEINTIIIGKNKDWKDNVNMGKMNNQSFVSIPHNVLISQISYKGILEGINVIVREESYTSKASFFDNDYIPTYGNKDNNVLFSGRRKYRGLYVSKEGIKINADINGALNIMRKELNVIPNVLINKGDIGLVVSPNRITFY